MFLPMLRTHTNPMFAAPIHSGWRFYLIGKSVHIQQITVHFLIKSVLDTGSHFIKALCNLFVIPPPTTSFADGALAGIQECTGYTNEERDASLGPRLHGDDKSLFMQQGVGTFRKHCGIILLQIPRQPFSFCARVRPTGSMPGETAPAVPPAPSSRR